MLERKKNYQWTFKHIYCTNIFDFKFILFSATKIPTANYSTFDHFFLTLILYKIPCQLVFLCPINLYDVHFKAQIKKIKYFVAEQHFTISPISSGFLETYFFINILLCYIFV